jgi:hypothetical protein
LLQEQVLKAAAELKGRKYAFDSTGKPIPITTIKSDTLPPFTYQPSLNVNSDPDMNKRGLSKKNAMGKKRGAIRVAGSRFVDHPPFIPTASLATTLSTHNVIPLSTGVVLQSGDVTREGPQRPDDPKRPSRKDFFQRQSLARSSLAANNTMGSILDTNGSISDASSWVDKPSDKPRGPPSSGLASLSMSTAAFSTSSNPRYKDIDPLEGARKVDPIEEGAKEDSLADSTPNDTIVKKGSMGLTGRKPIIAKPPGKPSDKQREIAGLLHGGPELQGPRDRLASHTLDSRRKITFAPQVLTGSNGSTSPKRSAAGLSSPTFSSESGKNNSFDGSSSSKGGTVKKERVDIVREIFQK